MPKTKKKRTKKFDEDLIRKAARLLKGETLTDDQKNSYRLHQSVRKKYRRLPINVYNRNEQWAIDLAEMNDLARYNYGYRYWLVCIDIYSRYVFVKLLKNKSSNNVTNKFQKILDESGEIPKKIQSDEGTEFQGIRNVLSKKYNFTVFSTYNREIKASHAERVIQTLKTMVRRVLTVTDGRNYSQYLPVIIQRYNNSPHKSLFNQTPYDIYFGNKTVPLKQTLLRELKNPVLTKNVLKIATKVRIVRAKNSVFEKSSLQRWTTEVFKVYKVYITDPVTYLLMDLKGEKISGKFYREELQIV